MFEIRFAKLIVFWSCVVGVIRPCFQDIERYHDIYGRPIYVKKGDVNFNNASVSMFTSRSMIECISSCLGDDNECGSVFYDKGERQCIHIKPEDSRIVSGITQRDHTDDDVIRYLAVKKDKKSTPKTTTSTTTDSTDRQNTQPQTTTTKATTATTSITTATTQPPPTPPPPPTIIITTATTTSITTATTQPPPSPPTLPPPPPTIIITATTRTTTITTATMPVNTTIIQPPITAKTITTTITTTTTTTTELTTSKTMTTTKMTTGTTAPTTTAIPVTTTNTTNKLTTTAAAATTTAKMTATENEMVTTEEADITSSTTVPITMATNITQCPATPTLGATQSVRDCKYLYNTGYNTDGVYDIYPDGYNLASAWCDMTNGGWTVFQKRYDGSVDFNRTWLEYRSGFGDPNGEYWLGLDNIYHLTAFGTTQLKIRMMKFGNPRTWKEITYVSFSLGACEDWYRLHLGNLEWGSDCNSLLSHDGQPFSTYDERGHVVTNDDRCINRAGWWYYQDNSCYYTNLNHPYLSSPGKHNNVNEGEHITWYCFTGAYESLEQTEMHAKRV